MNTTQNHTQVTEKLGRIFVFHVSIATLCHFVIVISTAELLFEVFDERIK